jgi:hypothetical protein
MKKALEFAKRYWWVFLVFAVVIALWGSAWLLILHFVPPNPNSPYSERGQFGDMFGAVNSLFAGLAFAGVVCALWLQREQIRQTQEQIQNASKPTISVVIDHGEGSFKSTIMVTNTSRQKFEELRLLAVVCSVFDREKSTLNEAGGATLDRRLKAQFLPKESVLIKPFEDCNGLLIHAGSGSMEAPYLKTLGTGKIIPAFTIVLTLTRQFDKRMFYKFIHYRGVFMQEGDEFGQILPLNASWKAGFGFPKWANEGTVEKPAMVRCRNIMSEFCRDILEVSPDDVLS